MSLSHSYFAFMASLICLGLAIIIYLRAVNPSAISAKHKLANAVQSEKMLRNTQQWWGKSKNQHHKRLANVVTMLRQAGYISSREQIICLLKVFLVWGSLLLIFFGQQLLSSNTLTQSILYLILFVALGFWMTLYWFRQHAQKRARIIDEEMLIAVHLMAILWQVGLSIESLLRAYQEESTTLTPEINKEISLILARINAGQNREWVFKDMAALSLSNGLQDLLTMLSQAGDSGGGLKNAFQGLANLLSERKRIELQEKVTKMSGKMSVTMMALMFPSLFIVLGGPAALALMAAFGG